MEKKNIFINVYLLNVMPLKVGHCLEKFFLILFLLFPPILEIICKYNNKFKYTLYALNSHF